MTDRDHFAAAAFTALIGAMRDETMNEICESAYGWADAMLSERERLCTAAPGYTAGISEGRETKPALTDAEREAIEKACSSLERDDRFYENEAASLRATLERLLERAE